MTVSLKNILIRLFAALLFVFVAISCAKDDSQLDIPFEGPITLSVSINNIETKSTIGTINSSDSIGKTTFNVLWSKSDAIAVINNDKLYRFVIADSCANSSKGTFILDKSALPAGYLEGDFNLDMPVRVFYPYNGVAYDAITNKITYNVPSEQSNSTYSMPMAGYCYNAQNEVKIKCLFGMLKLTFTGFENDYIKSIETIASNNINGIADVTINEGIGNEPEVSIYIPNNNGEDESSAESKRVILNCGNEDGSDLNTLELYISLPENTKDIQLLIHTSNESYYESVKDYYEFHKIYMGEILSLPQINISKMHVAYMENGVYLGGGIELPKYADSSETIIWAPVNCGYEAPVKDGGHVVSKGYPFGKLYQWGRKDGQGYRDNSYEDEYYPQDAVLMGTGAPEPDKFYYDWVMNSVREWPKESDPCPEGWRVPTQEEMLSLMIGLTEDCYISGLDAHWTSSNDDITSKHYGLPGFWFYGNTTSTDGEKVFFPAAGFRDFDFAGAHIRGMSGCYWSATSNDENRAWYLDINRQGYADAYYDNHASGRSVRCVKKQ